LSWVEELRSGAPVRRARDLSLSAPRLLLGSFAALIAFGTVGLLVLPSVYEGEPLGVVDALFTITSAVCVTGLTVVDTGATFSAFGEAWVLLMIQLGGLGILTFAALAAAALAGHSSLAVEEAAAGPASVLPAGGPMALVRVILVGTLVTELAGAVLLFALFLPRFGLEEAVWMAIFHAVSAFCNAGFALRSDNLVSFQEAPGVLLVVAALIMVGGIGFPVIEDLRHRLRGSRRRLTTHSRLTLQTTAILLVAATLLFLIFERGETLANLHFGHQLGNAFFMAVTPRTAGFNTVDYNELANPSLLLTIGLMWIGGSPGSTAGGVKTTTVALLALVLFARLRGDRAVSSGGRTVPEDTLHRAVGLAVGSVLLLAVFVFALILTELPGQPVADDRTHFIRLVFEAQSALGTVGLSMGATSELSPAGKLLVIALMFLGRVGPLAVVGAMAIRGQRRIAMRYAHEDVLVG
jgi:trk system potassium uptake protein TrkH